MWSEMDLQAAEWRIPAERMKGGREHTERMKGGREHRVPLSPASVETLEAVRELHQSGRLVLPVTDTGPPKRSPRHRWHRL